MASDPRSLARGLRAIAQRPTGAVGMPMALTPDEAAGGMMEPAQRPDVSRLVRGLRSLSQSMGGPVLDRMQARGERQQARLATGERSPSPLTGEDVDVADAVAGALMGPIKAFHGSPHRFDRFSMDKIGTGEGAQAYGHGLYFAENEGVARSYKEMLKGTVDPAFFDGMSFADEQAVKHIYDVAEEGMTNQEIIEKIQKNLMEDYAARRGFEGVDPNTFRGQLAREVEQRIAEKEHAMEVVASRGHLLKKRGEGALYTTRLNVEPEDLLDWDLPLSEQSEKVRAAVSGRIEQFRKVAPDLMPEDPTGQQIYRAFYPQELLGDAEAAMASKPRDIESRRLREAGIPGIRYLDQGSRASGEGTRNFVIFDDSLVDITHVDGKPLTKAERKAAIAAMMAGGMGAMQATGGDDGGS